MGPTKTSGFTKRSTNIILLVSLFSIVYFCLFLWDDAVIPQFLESKIMMKYGKQYDFSRAISNDDSNDSSRAVNTWEFHGGTVIEGLTESYSEPHIAIDTHVNIVATSGRNAVIEVQNNEDGRFSNDSVFKENTSREFHMPYEKHAISNRKNTVEILRSSLPIFDKPLQSASAKRGQIIIVTTKRSGSSFIGELFNSNPEVFYMYEPLFQVTFDVLKHRIDNRQAESLIFLLWNHTLRCNYSTFSQGTTNWLRRGGLNTCQLSGALKSSKLLCPVRKIPERKVGPIISKLCLDHPYTVLKTIRVNDIKDLRVFLEDPSLNLKIIHLVRDPRAVMNSRRKLKEPNSDLLRRKGPDADEIKDLCEHMARNLQYKDDPPSWLKGKYMLVRFEDVAEDPIEQTQRIYQHVGIKIHQDVLGWLKNNTHGNKGSPFSRTRDTEKVINAWKNSISEEVREEVEIKCSHVMSALSYEYG